MPTEGQIKLLARLTAAETIIQHMLWMIVSTKRDPIGELEAYRDRVLDNATTATIRGVDPAMSDLLAQELKDSLDNLLSDTIRRAKETPRTPQSI